jgi:hypothetical protein
MEKLIVEDIENHMKRINKQHQQHILIELLLGFGVGPRTMVEIFKKNKEISRGTVYNMYSGYVKNIPRKVESKLLKTLKIATEKAIMVANSKKGNYKFKTLEQIKMAIIEAKKYLNNLDEVDIAVFDMGVLEDNREIMDKMQQEKIACYIEHMIV